MKQFEIGIDDGLVLVVNGQRVDVQLNDIRGDKARIGVNAPSDVPVHRDEIQRRIQNSIKNGTRFSSLTPAQHARLTGN